MTYKITPNVNALWKAAKAIPSLDQRFAEDKSLVDHISGQSLITFARASSGSYTDSNGVLQTAVTNLLLRSEEFDNASWSKDNASIGANVVTAPNGSLTADKLIENTANATHIVVAGTSALTAGQPYVISVYLKAAERTFASIGSVTSSIGTGINLSTGALVDVNVPGWTNAATRSVTNIGNGWYRVAVTIPSATGNNSLFDSIRIFTNNGTTTFYTGDGTSGIYLWGAQLQQSATVGEYVPTGATINSAPRFDHNPTTGESLGLLVEEQRTNLLLRSEEFDNGTWLKALSTVTANAGTSPNGTSTADKHIPTNAFGSHFCYVSAAQASGIYTISIYAKAAEYTQICLFLDTSVTRRLHYFDLSAGSLGSNNGGVVGSITSAGNGWYRCSMTLIAAESLINQGWAPAQSGTIDFTGNGTNGILVWGAQLEAGAFPTSYIPTTTAAVTRAADVVSITDSNFSSWYNPTASTFFVDAAGRSTTAANAIIVQVDSGSAAQIFSIYHQVDEQAVFRARVNNTNVFATGFGTLTDGVYAKTAAAFSSGSSAACLNGGAVTSNTLTYSPSGPPVVFKIGENQIGTEKINGHIRRLTYFPQRLPNSNLQDMTI